MKPYLIYTLFFLIRLSAPAASYDASLGTLPTSQGWTLRDQGGSQPASITNGSLNIGPTSTSGDYSYYQNGVSIDYASGFTMTASLRILESSVNGNSGAGFVFDAIDPQGNRVNLGIGKGIVFLNSGGYFTIRSNILFATTNFATYTLVTTNTTATLFINGAKMAEIPLYLDNSSRNWAGYVVFGDVIGDLTCTADVQSFGYSSSAQYPVGYADWLTIPLPTYNVRPQNWFAPMASMPEGNVTLGGIPFQIGTVLGGNDAFSFDEAFGSTTPNAYEVPVGVYGVSEVQTILNTKWGQAGLPSYARIEFVAADGTAYGLDLIAGQDIRDWDNTSYANTINGTTTVNVWANDPVRLDKQEFILPSSFQSQTLDKIRFIDSGHQVFQRLIIFAVSIKGSLMSAIVNASLSSAAPEYTRFVLMGSNSSVTNDGVNPTTFNKVTNGSHTLNAFQNGHNEWNAYELWAQKEFAISGGQTTNISMARNLPYKFTTETYRLLDGTPITAGSHVAFAQPVVIDVTVTNCSGADKVARVTQQMRSPKNSNLSEPKAKPIPNNTVVAFSFTNKNDHVDAYGLNEQDYRIDTALGSYTLTDSGAWAPAYYVDSPLAFDYCHPDNPVTLDQNGSQNYELRVYDQNSSAGISGVTITVTNGMNGQSYNAASQTDANGVVTVPITVPATQANGTYDISFTASKVGYFNTPTIHRTIYVQHNVTPTDFGTTIITHGFVGGYTHFDDPEGWLVEMGCAVLRRAGKGQLWLFHCDSDILENVTAQHADRLVGVDTSATSREDVIIVKWEKTANNGSIFDPVDSPAGEAEAAGHQVYSLLMGGDAAGVHPFGFVGTAAQRKPLHFIGHSFGTVVLSEAIQRLGRAGIPVEQMTSLDPHDWDESSISVDEVALVPDVHVWSNVQYADNYYNRLGPISHPDQCPHGRDLIGATNIDLSDLSNFHNGIGFIPHSSVWAYYIGTIDPTMRGYKFTDSYYFITVDNGVTIRSDWYSDNRTIGFAFSRLGGRQGRDVFWDAINAARLGGDSLESPPNNSSRSNANGKSDISRDPPSDIFNWAFFPELFQGNIPEAPTDFEVPGYSTPVEADPSYFNNGELAARLYADGSGQGQLELKTHLTYVPQNAKSLAFELKGKRISGFGANDQLVVKFNDQVLGNPIAATDFPPLSTLFQKDITAFAGQSGIIAFSLQRGAGYGSEATIDNIRFGYEDTPVVAVSQPGGTVHNNQSGIINFGSPVQSTSAPKIQFTIQNIGGGTLTLSAVQVPSGFSIVGTPPNSLGASASGSFHIQLDTSTLGSKSGNVTFTCNDSAQSSFSFPVSGQVIAPATPPAIAVSVSGVSIANGQTSPVISIGSALISSAGPIQTFTIRNNGDQTLTIGSPTVPPGFILASAPPSSLTSGQSCTFGVQLDTSTAGTPFGDVGIPNNDSAKNSFTFRISGSVVQPTGSLTVTLNPAGAISAGAHWRVDGRTWRSSGYTETGLSAGSHTVEYQSVPFWYAPVSQSVNIVAGSTSSRQNSYVQVPLPTIGNLQRLPSGSISLDATGASGYSIVLQRSLDLQTWTSLQTNSATGGTFYDFDAPNHSNAFYRVKIQ